MSTADFNNDGWIDIYVANDTKANLLWINQRNGTFRNTALLAGVALTGDGKAEASMGVDAGDFDNDGDEDLFVTELPAEGSNLFVNDGTGSSTISALDPASARSASATAASAPPGSTSTTTAGSTSSRSMARFRRSKAQKTPFPYAEHKLLFRNRRRPVRGCHRQAGPAFARRGSVAAWRLAISTTTATSTSSSAISTGQRDCSSTSRQSPVTGWACASSATRAAATCSARGSKSMRRRVQRCFAGCEPTAATPRRTIRACSSDSASHRREPRPDQVAGWNRRGAV